MAIAASERRDERDGWAKKALPVEDEEEEEEEEEEVEADGLEFEVEVEAADGDEALLPATWELLEFVLQELVLL